jgi:hypothetical protein
MVGTEALKARGSKHFNKIMSDHNSKISNALESTGFKLNGRSRSIMINKDSGDDSSVER